MRFRSSLTYGADAGAGEVPVAHQLGQHRPHVTVFAQDLVEGQAIPTKPAQLPRAPADRGLELDHGPEVGPMGVLQLFESLGGKELVDHNLGEGRPTLVVPYLGDPVGEGKGYVLREAGRRDSPPGTCITGVALVGLAVQALLAAPTLVTGRLLQVLPLEKRPVAASRRRKVPTLISAAIPASISARTSAGEGARTSARLSSSLQTGRSAAAAGLCSSAAPLRRQPARPVEHGLHLAHQRLRGPLRLERPVEALDVVGGEGGDLALPYGALDVDTPDALVVAGRSSAKGRLSRCRVRPLSRRSPSSTKPTPLALP